MREFIIRGKEGPNAFTLCVNRIEKINSGEFIAGLSTRPAVRMTYDGGKSIILKYYDSLEDANAALKKITDAYMRHYLRDFDVVYLDNDWDNEKQEEE